MRAIGAGTEEARSRAPGSAGRWPGATSTDYRMGSRHRAAPAAVTVTWLSARRFLGTPAAVFTGYPRPVLFPTRPNRTPPPPSGVLSAVLTTRDPPRVFFSFFVARPV